MDNLSNHRHTGYDAVQVSYNDLLDKPSGGIYAKLTAAGATSVSNGSETLLNYSTSVFSSGITLDTTNKAMVIVTPGKYLLSIDMMWQCTVDGAMYQLRPTINRSNSLSTLRVIYGTSSRNAGTTYLTLNISEIFDFLAGDIIDVRCFQMSGSSQNANGNTDSFSLLKVA
jgi:hypothetical protein